MKHLFVPYEIARQLKEKGFNEPCLGYYSMILDRCEGIILFEVPEFDGAPLYQQIIDWFREIHKIDVRVFPMYESEESYKTCWGWNNTQLEWGIEKEHHIANAVRTREYGLKYYEALTKAIEAAIKLLN